jgi:hypothetical protein
MARCVVGILSVAEFAFSPNEFHLPGTPNRTSSYWTRFVRYVRFVGTGERACKPGSSTCSNPSDPRALGRVRGSILFRIFWPTDGLRIVHSVGFVGFLVWRFCKLRAVNAAFCTTSINHIVYASTSRVSASIRRGALWLGLDIVAS